MQHDSLQPRVPSEGRNVVTRKVTRGIAQILAGTLQILGIGNLDGKRDWGHPRDYVRAMWLQQDDPDDYVIASGVDRSVRDFVDPAFSLADLDSHKYVEVDKAYMRPADLPDLRGDATEAATKLGWKPAISFDQLVHEMLEHDLTLEGVDPAKHLGKPPASVLPNP
jgi:GDPmannose 4,6-dehydratase